MKLKSTTTITFAQSHPQKFLFDRMLFKIIDSLRTLTNETISVQELLKGDIPREDESQNSSDPVSVLGQDRGRLIPSAPAGGS